MAPERLEEGRVEVHWVVGEGDLEGKRRREAALLAERFSPWRRSFAFSQMAVLVRSRTSLPHLEAALRARGCLTA